jgi:hypothetical protein
LNQSFHCKQQSTTIWDISTDTKHCRVASQQFLSEEQEANEKMVKKHRVTVGSDFERYRLDTTRRLSTTKSKSWRTKRATKRFEVQ